MFTSLSVKNAGPSTPSSSTGTVFGIKLNVVGYPKMLSVICPNVWTGTLFMYLFFYFLLLEPLG